MPPARLTRPDKVGLALLVLLAVGFGAVVEIRSAFQRERKTDFGVYARAGWAVRAGHDPYSVYDDRGWHYCYPPPFAVFMAPLADPPAGEPRAGYLPFWASALVWYLFGVGCVGWAVHTFAKAALPDAVPGSRRWWYARTIPALVCIGGVGFTLARGQVNLLLVALAAGMFAAAVRGRLVSAGVWLAAAVSLKVIPAFLGLFPALRRDVRGLAGLAAGLVLWLAVVPAAVWGVGGAVELNKKTVDLVLTPGATGEGDQTRAKELTGAKATDSQSFQSVIHALRYPDRATRPDAVDKPTRLAHVAIVGLLTLTTAAVYLRRRPDRPADQLVLLGGLCMLMMLATPISHMHYYAFGLPLACGLWLKGLAARPGSIRADRPTVAALAAWGVLTALPLFPGPLFDRLREAGCGTLASVGLWAFGLAVLGRRAVAETKPAAEPLRWAA